MQNIAKAKNPISHRGLRGFSYIDPRAHNRDRTGDLILTKDVLYRLSYVSDLRTAWATPKDYVRRQTLSVDELEVIGNPLGRALAWSVASLERPTAGPVSADLAVVVVH